MPEPDPIKGASETALPSWKDAVRLFLYGCAAAVALHMGGQALRHSVDAPYGADWVFLRLAHDYAAGKLTAAGLVLAAPWELGGPPALGWNLMLWGLAGINSGVSIAVTWLAGVLLCFLCWALARQGATADSLTPAMAFASAGFFVFHPGGHQLWLSGATQTQLGAAVLLLAALLVFQKRLRRSNWWLAAALAGLLLSLPALFRSGFSLTPVLLRAGSVTALAGDAEPHPAAAWVGLAMLAFFAAVAIRAHQTWRNEPAHGAVQAWICAGLYSILGGMMETEKLEAGRWTASAWLLPVSVVALSLLLLERTAMRLPYAIRTYTAVTAALASMLAGSLMLRGAQTERAERLTRHAYFTRLAGKIAMLAANDLQPPEFHYLSPGMDYADFRTLAGFAFQKGWVQPAPWDQAFYSRCWALNAGEASDFGNLETLEAGPGNLTLGGWAYLAHRSERAHGVLILGQEQTGGIRALGLAWPSIHRPDVQRRMRTQESLITGWRADIPMQRLPAKNGRIRAFACDGFTGHCYPLTGERTPAGP